jgi:hypothetical protein
MDNGSERELVGRMRNPGKPRSCFLHVAKCGGSSIISLLGTCLGVSNVFHANASRYQQAPLGFLLQRYPVVVGHFTFAQISAELLADTFFFTFLREPVDRALSLYYYCLQEGTCHGRDHTAEAARLEADRLSPWSNWQTYLFSGAAHCDHAAVDLLPAALRNLEQMDLVGIHDELEAGMQRLAELRGWTLQPALPRVNVTAGRPPREAIDPALVDRFRALNRCDAVLYARARELWADARTRPARSVSLPATPLRAEPCHTRTEHGTREIVVTDLAVAGAITGSCGAVAQYERAVINLRGRSSIAAADVTVGIRISDSFGVEVYGVNTFMLGVPIALGAGQQFELTFTFDMVLARGVYFLTVGVHAAEDHLRRCYHWIDNALAFECRPMHPPSFAGVADLKAAARVKTGPS